MMIQKTTMRISQIQFKRIIIISSLIGLLSYVVPYLMDFISPSDDDFKFFDTFYAIGISFGFGGVLLGIYLSEKELFKYTLAPIAVFFIGLGFTFIFNSLTDKMFETMWFVLFNLIIAICFLFVQLILRKASTFGR